MAPIALVLSAQLAAGVAAATQPATLERLHWLQGCWEIAEGDRTIEEHWLGPRGRSMLGVSRTVRAGALAEYEFVVIRERKDGLAYEARPSGQAPTVFVARTIDADSVVFENPGHDFPQRVGYRRLGPDSMLAWIEGRSDKRARLVEFPYRRVACTGG